VLSIAVAFASVASASSSGRADPGFHEIVASASGDGICGNVVVHANAAIAAAKRDDAAIASALLRLRGIDFDTPSGARRAAITEIEHSASDIPSGAGRVADETRRLRAFATTPAGADRSADIAAFTDALDAAAAGQRSVADALATFLSLQNARDLRDSARDASIARTPDPENPEMFHGASRPPTALSTPSMPTMRGTTATLAARSQAADLEGFVAQIASDEARAASHSEAAVGGC
jgi:hypothetical protein